MNHCPHGFREVTRNCATCHKSPGECDFGTCSGEATHVVWTKGNLWNKYTETFKPVKIDPRPMCTDHAMLCAYLNKDQIYSIDPIGA